MFRELIEKLEIKALDRELSSAHRKDVSHYWLRSKITAHIVASKEEYLNEVILPKAILDFIQEDINESNMWQEVYCSYVKDHYVVWIFTPCPGNVIGKESERIDRLRDHMWEKIGTNTEIRIVEMTYGLLREIQNLDPPPLG